MDAHVWAPTGMVKDPCGTWYYSIDVAEELAAIRTDCASYRRYADQARDELTALRPRVDFLIANNEQVTAMLQAREAELAAEREAVRVLGEATASFSEHMDCRPSCGAQKGDRCTCGEETFHTETMKPIYANPLAAAAVRRAGGG